MSKQRSVRVGVLGAGQLALMLAEAGKRIGVEVICAGAPGDCAESVAQVLPVDLDDPAAVREFAARVDVVTVESENIDAGVLQDLNLAPNARAIGIAQDRLMEKHFLQDCGIEVAPFAPVSRPEDFASALQDTALPAILKTRRMGYDGKGQVRLSRASDLPLGWEEVGEVPCIVEGMLHFNTEVSLIAARGHSGEIVFYPLVENFHRDGILRKSVAPYMNGKLQSQAETYLQILLERLDYVGVLTVEFFVTGDRLIANEMAPRVHNSGHWTIEGSASSQFENHLRAITGMPLGSTVSEPMVMLNCIGSMPAEEQTERDPHLLHHDYGKEFRPGRKVGHLTFPASAMSSIAEWQAILEQQN